MTFLSHKDRDRGFVPIRRQREAKIERLPATTGIMAGRQAVGASEHDLDVNYFNGICRNRQSSDSRRRRVML